MTSVADVAASYCTRVPGASEVLAAREISALSARLRKSGLAQRKRKVVSERRRMVGSSCPGVTKNRPQLLVAVRVRREAITPHGARHPRLDLGAGPIEANARQRPQPIGASRALRQILRLDVH